jgi:D-tyrosyl-tRNA(Tyr) deacylase
MRALIQRVRGNCTIDIPEESYTQNFNGVGLVVLLGWLQEDIHIDPTIIDGTEDWLLSRILGLRIFEDKNGKMNLNLEDYSKEHSLDSGILWVSQFTLAAELESGFRPSFTKAMNPIPAEKRYHKFCEKISSRSPHKNIFGIFGKEMDLSFNNWGPVTILLEKK